jgi:DNA-binding NarL/FixJ family response regulator
MSAPRDRDPRVLVALRHPRLRAAVAAELDVAAHVSVIGAHGDLDCAVRAARSHRADGLVIGVALLRDDLVASLRGLVASLPSTRVVVVGTDASDHYARALEAAGAAAYVSLVWGGDALAATVRVAMRKAGIDAPTASARDEH